MRLVLVYLFICCGFISISAQENKSSHYSSWNTFNIHRDINDAWTTNVELNFRRTDFLDHWQQFIVRPFIHYKPDEFIDLSVGYSYIKNYHYSEYSVPIDAIENNVFQQLIISQFFKYLKLEHRARLEERFAQRTLLTQEGNYVINGVQYKNRFRYRFQVSIPLREYIHKAVSVVLYDEVHLNLGNGLRPRQLDQNWMFFGLSFRISDRVKIRSGYHDIYSKRDELYLTNNIWETTLTFKL